MGRTEDLMTVDKAEEAALPPPGVADVGKGRDSEEDMDSIRPLDNSGG